MNGAVIVLSGPDGTGKSTIADRLEAWASSGSMRIHHRPRVLPGVSRASDPSRPHASKPRGRVASQAKVLYVFFDYLFGWLFRVLPAKRRGATVIIERGWWDMIADPTRYRLQGIERLAKGLGAWLPKPDLRVILYADPDLLLGRKAEIPASELKRQMRVWQEFGTGRGALLIDCSAPLDQIVEEIVSVLGTKATST